MGAGPRSIPRACRRYGVLEGNGRKRRARTGGSVLWCRLRAMRRDQERPRKLMVNGLTWRPARAEWLCCFLGPSAADVLPPELFPPDDFPFPPAIVDDVVQKERLMRGAVYKVTSESNVTGKPDKCCGCGLMTRRKGFWDVDVTVLWRRRRVVELELEADESKIRKAAQVDKAKRSRAATSRICC